MPFDGYNSDNDSGAFVATLREQYEADGWTMLGSKANPLYCALLMVSPDGKRVLKVASDSGWDGYMHWAIQNQHLRHVPRIYMLRRDDGYTICEMECLQPLPFEGNASRYKPVPGIKPSLARLVRRAAEVTRRSCTNWGNGPAGRDSVGKCLDAMESALGTAVDLHGYNIMRRPGPRGGAGSLVLIDPYAG